MGRPGVAVEADESLVSGKKAAIALSASLPQEDHNYASRARGRARSYHIANVA
jgi:hypothetical protein